MADGPKLITGADGATRCWWCGDDPLYVAYHDDEWGRPVDDDVRLFEKICLEGFQAGLSWITVLRKREDFRKAFAGFDFIKVARFTEAKVDRLVTNARIIRHRGKIESTVNNANQALKVVDEFGSLAAFFWRFEPSSHSAFDGCRAMVPESTGAQQGAKTPRLVLRWADDLLRFYASNGDGKRPPHRLHLTCRSRRS